MAGVVGLADDEARPTRGVGGQVDALGRDASLG